eukprot:m.86080 g.86080  ORF g.86080 m.86080 type:complete len:85 (-) comp19818_c0_seq1:378-632(-)
MYSSTVTSSENRRFSSLRIVVVHLPLLVLCGTGMVYCGMVTPAAGANVPKPAINALLLAWALAKLVEPTTGVLLFVDAVFGWSW